MHDIGGPVGFEPAAAMPERARSLTVLNTMVEVDSLGRPRWMEPFARRGLGEAYLAARTREKRDLYVSALRDTPHPVQVVWGAADPVLSLARQGEEARRAAGLERIHTVPAKHFLQEDQAPAVAERVAALA